MLLTKNRDPSLYGPVPLFGAKFGPGDGQNFGNDGSSKTRESALTKLLLDDSTQSDTMIRVSSILAPAVKYDYHRGGRLRMLYPLT